MGGALPSAGRRGRGGAKEGGELPAKSGNRDRRQGRGPLYARIDGRPTWLSSLRQPQIFSDPVPPAGRPESGRLVFDGDVDIGEPLHREVAERFHAGAKPNHLAVAENQKPVGLVHVVEVVGDRDHGHARPGPLRQKCHDPGLGGRIEAGGRLVEHEQARRGKHFCGQTRPLHLPPRKITDRLEPHPLEADLGDDAVNRGPPLGRRYSRRKPHIRGELERPLDRQGRRIDVSLGDIADRAAECVGFPKNVVPPDKQPAGGDLPLAEQTPHERALAGAAGAEHADELARLNPKAHPIEERSPLPSGTAIRHRHGQSVGHDREACLQCERHGRGSWF